MKMGLLDVARGFPAALFLLLGLSPVLAAPVDSVPVGRWYAFQDSRMESVAPRPSPSGNTGVAAVMSAWSSGVYDTDRDRLVVWGGGHADYAGNEVYAFGPLTGENPAWTRLTNPSSPAANNTSYAPDGAPVSRHTYDSIEYIPGKLIAAGSGGQYSNGYSSSKTDLFDFSTNTWSRGPDVQMPGSGIFAFAAYNAATKYLWYMGGESSNNRLQRYDPSSNTWTSFNATLGLYSYATAAIDTSRNQLLAYVQGRGILRFDLNSPNSAPVTINQGGSGLSGNAQAPGFVYDPVNDRFVAWNGGTTLYALSIPSNLSGTWQWSVVPLDSGNAVSPGSPAPAGTYGRFRYVPSLHAVVVVNAVDQPVYLRKLERSGGTQALPTVSLSASPASITSGGSAALTWSASNAASCTASGGWSGPKATSGSQSVSPADTSTYSLSCTGSGGTGSASATVTVTPPAPTLSLSASPASITSGASATLTWSSTNATSCTASGAWSGTKGASGSQSVTPNSTSQYALACTGAGGSVNRSATVTVTQAAPAPTVSLSANPISITSGGSATLTWSSTNATSCTASGDWSGAKATSGSQSMSPTGSSTYNLSCTGAGGSGSDSATVTVSSGGTGGGGSGGGGSGGSGPDLVTVDLQNTAGASQSNVPVTFGQVFKPGEVPAGQTVVGRLSDGSAVSLQVDKKAAHADGSLRHAILTAQLPSLGSGGERLTLSRSSSGLNGTAVSLSSLLSSGFDARVELTVNGTLYSASARDLLQNATPKAWLSGPLASEWLVGGPVKTAGGAAHAHLTAYFYVRAYAGLQRVRVDTVVENGWSFVSGPSNQTYNVNLYVGSNLAYSRSGLTHYHHARWHKVHWWGNAPQVYAKLDHRYLQDTKAIPKYEDLTPTEGFLNSVRRSTEPMDNGDQTDNMDDTGFQEGIGPLPKWDATYAVSADKRAYDYMLANADGGSAYGIHYRDEQTGYPVTIDAYPNSSLADPNGSNPRFPNASGGNPYYEGQWSSHQPSIGYLPYLVSGDYYYLEEAQFWSAYNLIWTSRSNRSGASGWWYTGSIRGQAWAYRSLAQVAYITPDDHALKDYFVGKLRNNLARDTALYVSPGGPHKNNLGAMYSYDGNEQYRFFDYFMSWAVQYMVDLGFTEATAFRDYKVKFPIGLMGMAEGEYCFQLAPQYTWKVGPTGTSTFYPDFATVYANTAASASTRACGSQAMASHLGVSLNEMVGQQTNTTYYFANLQPALAAAYDSGVPGGQQAWERAQLSGKHPNYRDMPIWAVVPRTLASSSPSAPTVSLSASPASISAGASATLTWSSSNATSCTASGGWSGAKATSGTQSVSPTSTSTYTLACTGTGGSTSRSATVTVSAAPTPPAPTVSLSVNPGSVLAGTSATLTWSSTDATSCTASGAWSGAKATSGTQSVSPTSTSTYSLACTGAGGSTSRSATLTVTQPAPQPAPTVSISANPSSIPSSASSTLTWSAANATSCTASGAWSGTRAASGTQSVSPSSTGTYTLSCTGAGGSANGSATVTVQAPAAPTVSLSASPTSIQAGASSTLTWSSTNASSCTASGAWSGSRSTSGTQNVSPNNTGTYTLSCTGAGGSVNRSVTVTVTQAPLAPVVSVSASPTSIQAGASSVLTWSAANATSCTASGAWSGTRATSGTQSVSPSSTGSYTLSCTGAGGSASGAATVTVTQAAPPPTVSLSASPSSIQSGASSTLTWSSTNASSCTASGAWSGARATSGSQTVSPNRNRSYTLACTGAGGTASRSVTVTVTAAPPPAEAALNLSASPAVVAQGESAVLSWSSSNTSSCSASGAWSGAKGVSGSQTVSPASGASTYTLDCSGPAGTISRSVTIAVTANEAPPGDGPTDPPGDGDDGSAEPPYRPVLPLLNEMPRRNASFTVSADYLDPNGDPLASARWQISRDENFSSLVLDRTVQGKTTLALPTGVLESGRGYWVRTSHMDNTGLSSEWSQPAFFVVTADANDSDGDGVDDRYQVSGFVDSNRNGIDDRDENMCNLKDGEGQSRVVGFRSDRGALRCVTALSAAEVPTAVRASRSLPYGLLGLRVEGLPVNANQPAVAVVTAYLPAGAANGSRWYRYDETRPVLVDMSGQTAVEGQEVVLHLVDGGAMDADGAVNGAVVMLSGLVVNASVGAQTSTDAPEAGGGAVGPLSLLSLLGMILMLGARRRTPVAGGLRGHGGAG